MVLVEFAVSLSLRSPYSHCFNLADFSVFIGKTNLCLSLTQKNISAATVGNMR